MPSVVRFRNYYITCRYLKRFGVTDSAVQLFRKSNNASQFHHLKKTPFQGIRPDFTPFSRDFKENAILEEMPTPPIFANSGTVMRTQCPGELHCRDYR